MELAIWYVHLVFCFCYLNSFRSITSTIQRLRPSLWWQTRWALFFCWSYHWMWTKCGHNVLPSIFAYWGALVESQFITCPCLSVRWPVNEHVRCTRGALSQTTTLWQKPVSCMRSVTRVHPVWPWRMMFGPPFGWWNSPKDHAQRLAVRSNSVLKLIYKIHC